MLTRRTVLVVDPLDETHEVLKAALGRRGVDVVGSRDSIHGLAMARQHRPHLIVLDVEGDSSSGELPGRLANELASAPTPMLILGKLKQGLSEEGGYHVLAKPFHYAPLIRKIEDLLAA